MMVLRIGCGGNIYIREFIKYIRELTIHWNGGRKEPFVTGRMLVL